MHDFEEARTGSIFLTISGITLRLPEKNITRHAQRKSENFLAINICGGRGAQSPT